MVFGWPLYIVVAISWFPLSIYHPLTSHQLAISYHMRAHQKVDAYESLHLWWESEWTKSILWDKPLRVLIFRLILLRCGCVFHFTLYLLFIRWYSTFIKVNIRFNRCTVALKKHIYKWLTSVNIDMEKHLIRHIDVIFDSKCEYFDNMKWQALSWACLGPKWHFYEKYEKQIGASHN